MRLLIVLLLSLGMATEWGSSISIRTPNDEEKELDYEFSIKIEDTNDKIRYLLKRDWERELGEKYIDDVVKFSHQVYDGFYYGVDYVSKESKDIFYTTYNIGVTSNGFNIGVSVKEEVGRYKIEITTYVNSKNGKTYVLETIFDTKLGKVIERKRFYHTKYGDKRKKWGY